MFREAYEAVVGLEVHVQTRTETWSREVVQYRCGKTQRMGFLVGQVMKRSAGSTEPQGVRRFLQQTLERDRPLA